MEMPEWLNESFLTRAIRSYKNDASIEIVKFNAGAAFAEHYASKMYRVNLEFKSMRYAQTENDNEVLSVVIKAQPINCGEFEMFVTNGPYFETEMEIYHKIIPAMNQLFHNNGIKVEFAPELIYTTNEPFSIIVLRDLTPDDFKVWSKALESVDDLKLITERLAQFHAASIYLNDSNLFDFVKFNYSMYDMEEIVDSFSRDTLKTFKEILSTWDDCESYIPKVEKLITDIAVIGRKIYKANAKNCGFNVLNHGDFHLRNILIKGNREHHIESFNFIDYQCSVWCSSVVDLTYLMGLVRFDDNTAMFREELIVIYHQKLVDALKSIGYMKAAPSLIDLNVELLKHGSLNVIVYLTLFPFLTVDWDTMSLDDMMGNDSKTFKKKLFESPVLKQLIMREMKSWTHKGWW